MYYLIEEDGTLIKKAASLKALAESVGFKLKTILSSYQTGAPIFGLYYITVDIYEVDV